VSHKSPSSPTEGSSDSDERLAQVLVELTDCVQRGERVDIDSVCGEHPDLSDELRQLWGAVMIADAIGSHKSESAAAESKGSALMSLRLPCEFGDYRLLEEVGHGGMGVVYRAWQISLNREVAVKMILRGPLASSADRERFRAEAEAAARLDHKGIVPVYDFGEHDDRPYFCMKYVKGRTLAQVLAEGLMTARDSARILAAVARASHFGHRQGVLHRDLKPSNIMIDNDGEPHITDFGLAKRDTDVESLTRSGAVLGTPAYMAPEQAAGARGQVGPRSDVYSLGSILYHMLTGRPPFQAASAVDTVLMVLEQDPVPPRVINPKVDRNLELIALKCLQKPADLRYDSAQALASDLEAYLEDEPLSIRRGLFAQFLSRLFRETHHAPVLENWGLLWMWHSLAIFVACSATNVMHWLEQNHPLVAWTGVTEAFQVNRWYYVGLWTVGFWTWAAVFWFLRRRMGPVTFVERQIAHVWGASTLAVAALFPIEWLLGLEVLELSPVVALIGGMVFFVKAGILSGTFYIQFVALFATAGLMAWLPDYGHLMFGTVSAACFFFPGLKYYRQRIRSDRQRQLANARSLGR